MSQKKSALPLSATWSGWKAPSRVHSADPPTPGASPLPPLQPRFKPSPRGRALLRSWLLRMGPRLHRISQSLTPVNPGPLETDAASAPSVITGTAESLLCPKTHAVWRGERQRNSVFANNIAC